MYKFFIFLFNILLIFLLFNNLYSISDDNLNSGKISIKPFCLSSLEYYTNKPQLETEYLRRLEYCINTSKDISPEGFKVNPIISDFRSQFGVNGRTRMTLHQGVDIIAKIEDKICCIQCKRYSNPVGNKAVQEIYAGTKFYSGTDSIVVSNAGFTKQAEELARSLRVFLISDSKLAELENFIL